MKTDQTDRCHPFVSVISVAKNQRRARRAEASSQESSHDPVRSALSVKNQDLTSFARPVKPTFGVRGETNGFHGWRGSIVSSVAVRSAIRVIRGIRVIRVIRVIRGIRGIRGEDGTGARRRPNLAVESQDLTSFARPVGSGPRWTPISAV
jgi:hypothetical protein